MAEKPAVSNETNEIKETAPEAAPAAEAPAPAAEPVHEPVGEPKQPHKRKHRKKHYLLRLVVVLVLIAAAILVAHLDYFNINGIAVVGNEEVTDEEIIKLSGVTTGGSVFDVHPILVEHKIKKNLYIEKVNVNRKLPTEIEIIVTERSLLAQFRKDDKYIVTDSEGMVLDITKEPHKATLIEGVTVTATEKKETIGIKEKDALERSLELIRTTEENDLYFKRIVFDGRKVDAYIYDGLKCSGKYDNLMSAITSGTLKKVIYDLYQKGVEKGTVNVYNNDYCFFTPN